MKIFSTYGFSLSPKLLILTFSVSFGLAGCSSVTNALNPGNIYSDIFQNKAARSDVLKADVENRAHSDFILRGGSLSRLPSLQTNDGITPQPSQPVETKPLSEPPLNNKEEPEVEKQTQGQEKAPAFPGLSGVVQ
jgi:hypothetical protein